MEFGWSSDGVRMDLNGSDMILCFSVFCCRFAWLFVNVVFCMYFCVLLRFCVFVHVDVFFCCLLWALLLYGPFLVLLYIFAVVSCFCAFCLTLVAFMCVIALSVGLLLGFFSFLSFPFLYMESLGFSSF